MDIKTIKTPEQLHQAIVKFLESDYSNEDLVKTYNDARKCMIRFRGDYSALPILPSFKDNALDGLQEVMDWCIKSSEVVNDIVFNLERETITKIIRQFKKLRDFANRIVSLIDGKLREQAQKEARAKVEKEYKNLNEKASSLKIEAMPLVRQVQVLGGLQLKEQEILRRETKETVQIYLSKDPNFKNKLSHIHDEEINEVFETLNKLAGSETPTGKLFDIYCKLKDIPLQRQFDDVGYAYSLNDLTDVICSGCSRLYTSVDNVIKTFEEIRTKAEEKAEKSQPQEKPGETGLEIAPAEAEKAGVNIHISGGIRAENVQIANSASIQTDPKPEPKRKFSILGWMRKRFYHLVGAVIVGLIVVILVDIFADLGWVEQIKTFVYKILRIG